MLNDKQVAIVEEYLEIVDFDDWRPHIVLTFDEFERLYELLKTFEVNHHQIDEFFHTKR